MHLKGAHTMQTIDTAVRNWECLSYCQTQDNCSYACGLAHPLSVMEQEEERSDKTERELVTC